jgi:carbon-monoxide dehydrogenase medium subunit
VIPAAFGYVRATSLDHAVDVLAARPGGVTILAGGQSLLPALKKRSRRAELVLDIGRLAELRYVHDRADHLAIGALTPHAALVVDNLVARRAPLLRAAAAEIADPQVRHMGTIGGSLAFADPAADLAVAATALSASVVVRGSNGERELSLAHLFVGRHATALTPDELIVEIRVPTLPEPAAWSYHTFHRDALEWSVVGVAAVGGSAPSIALAGMGPTVLRASAVEEALRSGASAAEAAEHASEGTEPATDVRASAGFRRHLVGVLVRRALTEIGVRS